MPYNKTTWVDRDVQFPKRYTKSGETATQVTLSADAGIVTQEGTPVNAANLNKMEQGILDADQAAAAAQTTANGKVSKAGDTMTGALTLSGNPTATNHASNKGYVDTQDASLQTQITSLGTSKADKTYVDSQDGTKVSKAGDTMTGALVLNADPTVTLGASTKGYVDTQVATKVSKAGDTMTGALTLSGNPTATNHAATKGYVDTQITNLVNGSPAALDTLNELATALGNDANFSTTVTNSIATKAPINNPTFTGAVTLPANPTTTLGAATKGYVDTQDELKVNKAGDTMTGALVLSADPTVALGAATKGYVDTSVAGKVNKAGDTMTGALVLSADPTVALGAATKQYVDNIFTNLPDSSITTAKLANGAVTAAKLDPTLTTTVGLGVLQEQVDGKVNKSGDTMTGALNVIAGTATTPAIAPAGTSNTGIFFPTVSGSTIVAITRNGQEALRINQAGNLLIGTTTTSPTSQRLTVAGNANISGYISASSINGATLYSQSASIGVTARTIPIKLEVANRTTSDDFLLEIARFSTERGWYGNTQNRRGIITFCDSNQYSADSTVYETLTGGIAGVRDDPSVDRNGGLALYVNQTGAGTTPSIDVNNLTEAMRINSAGNVGIGTTSPTSKLEVNGNAIVATPTATNHAATKGYVDNVSVGSVIYEYKNLGGAL